jgi:hypothetical protein
MTWSRGRATSVPWSPISSAHEIATAVDHGNEVDPEDIDTAIENYRELYELLIEDRRAAVRRLVRHAKTVEIEAESAQSCARSTGSVDREGGGRFTPPGWGRGRGGTRLRGRWRVV